MAITTLGGLHVEITAGNKDLKTKVKQTSDILKKGRKSLNDNAAMWAKWGGAVVAASAIAATAIFKSQAKSIDQLAKTADKLGITTEALTGLRLAAEQTGVETRTMDMALQRMVRRLSEAAAGGGEAKGAIEELGLSAQDLAAQRPEEAMKTIADAMSGVENQSDKVRLAFKFFDSEGVALVNTMALGSEGLNKFEKDAKKLGIAISRVDAAKVEQANDALNIASKVVDGALKEATIQIAPLVTALAKSFSDAAKESGGMGDLIAETFDNIIDGVGFVLDAIDGIDRVFEAVGKSVAVVGLGIAGVMLEIANAIVNKPVEAVNELIEALNMIPFMDDLMPVSLTGFGAEIKSEMELTTAAIAIGMADIGEIFERPMPSEGLKKAVIEARVAADELAKITAEQVAPKQEEETGDKGGKVQAVSEESKAILEELQNRYASEKELLQIKLAEEHFALGENLLAKNITQEEFDALAQERNQEHQEALTAIEAQEQSMRNQQVTDSLSAMATLMSLGGKKTEKAVRALAIASAIIKGHESAVAAFAAGMSVGGPFAPATAALYTAASIAQTGMMISKLASGSKTPSRPSGSVPKAGGSGSGGSGSGGSGSGRKFDITLVGSTFSAEQVRELMNSIGEQFSDGVKFSVGQQ